MATHESMHLLVILANAGIHLCLLNWRRFWMDPRVREGDGMSRVTLPKLSRTVVRIREDDDSTLRIFGATAH